ncbi:MAG TPA: hypothetical protein VKY51_06360 [Fredinandcohnia sp.]|nr:hypothetical protein [Fredinandcohnia sp.]
MRRFVRAAVLGFALIALPAIASAEAQVPAVQLQNVQKTPPKPGIFHYTEAKANALKLAGAVALAALLVWGWNLEEKGEGKKYRRQRRLAIGLLGVLGVFGWFNYGKFHSGKFIHIWEHYHYYMGSKYFPELRYTRLYECSAVAEAELYGKERVARRTMRDIAETNLIGSTDAILAHPEKCTSHFTPARWEAFKKDTAYFIRKLGGRWANSQKDHGYNGTPWWSIVPSLLTNALGEANDRTILLLGILDPLLIVLMFVGIGWAFGLEIFAVAATFFAVNFPSRFYWNGGAFLRYDYLALSVLGICMLRKKKDALGGAMLAAGAAFRIFPVFFAVGPAMQGLWRWVKEKAMPRSHRRILVGALVATAILVPGSMIAARGGIEVYQDFTRNTLKHAETPLTNHMGLRTVLSWRPWSNARHLKDETLVDPFQVWKEQRLANFERVKPLFYLLNLALLWLVFRRSRNEEPWFAASLAGIVMIPAATELTCYYYAFMIPAAFLMEKKREIGLWLLVLGIGTHAITKLPIWSDDQYMWMGLATVAYGVMVLWTLAQPEGARTPVAQPAVAPVRSRKK